MNSISIAFCYYRNPRMLEYQWGIWRSYPESVEIILVDDCSPAGLRAEEVIARHPKLNCKFKLYRILADMPWNQPGARNLGVKHATGKWEVTMDMDHIVTLDGMNYLLNFPLEDDTIYSFKRVDHFTREKYHAHWESKLMTRDMYWSIGGFDESFVGHYAFPERDWLNKFKHYKTIELPLELERVGDTHICDAKTVGLIRKEGRDDAAWQEIIDWKKDNGIGIELFKLPWKRIL